MGQISSRRTRRIWFSLVATLGGLLAVIALGLWINSRRDTDLGDPTASVTTAFLHVAPPDAPAIRFDEVATESGIQMRHGPGPRGRTLPEDTGSGLAWGDYDGDGDFDLYVVNFPGPLGQQAVEESSNRLFRNDGATFADVTIASGTADRDGFGMGASFADFDADGLLDLYVTNFGPNRLFRNRGDGTFEDVGEKSGVDDGLWSTSTAWGDFDRDGRIDLYVTNYVDFDAEDVAQFEVTDANWEGIPFTLNPNAFDPQPNRLYLQTKTGQFSEMALESGASNPEGRSLGATTADLDADGWLDIYVANDVSPNALLRNQGGDLGGEVLFEDLGAPTGTADPRGSMGLSVTDISLPGEEPDGLPDLFITHWVAQENALYQALRIDARRIEYRDKIRQVSLGEISTNRVGWGSAFLDVDLDGRADLAVANGSTLEDGQIPPGLIAQTPFLFWDQDGRFFDLAPIAGPPFEREYVGRGLAAGDYDGDGDWDLAISVNRGPVLLLRNSTETENQWLAVRLTAPTALSSGAQVDVQTGDLRQTRWWGSDASYASHHTDDIVFGLGANPKVSTVRVRWRLGSPQEFRALEPNRRLVLAGPA